METKIKYYRKKKNYTQQFMASKLNISRQTYINYEKGSFEPSLDTLKLISQLLETSIDELLNNNVYTSNSDKESKIIEEIKELLKDY